MHPQGPRTKPASIGTEKAALFSIGSLEEKIPFVLYPLLLSLDLVLCRCKNYEYPKNLSVELINEIKSSLQKKKIKSVVFDLRIHDWINTPCLRRSRILAQSLQDICSDLQISNSIILSNGGQLIGNAVGVFSEKMEAREVLRGEGPPDLTKFALEIGADFLLMTKKTNQRIEAKKWLRDQIINGEFTSAHLDFTEKRILLSQKKGYVHHLAMEKLHALRSYLTSVHPVIGLSLKKKPGDWIAKGDAIVDVHLSRGQKNPIKQETCQRIFVISNDSPNHQPLILERLGLNIHS
jgi:pyrimidine-nucleoside phosphorylase